LVKGEDYGALYALGRHSIQAFVEGGEQPIALRVEHLPGQRVKCHDYGHEPRSSGARDHALNECLMAAMYTVKGANRDPTALR
jgi:hypothetical protein